MSTSPACLRFVSTSILTYSLSDALSDALSEGLIDGANTILDPDRVAAAAAAAARFDAVVVLGRSLGGIFASPRLDPDLLGTDIRTELGSAGPTRGPMGRTGGPMRSVGRPGWPMISVETNSKLDCSSSVPTGRD